MYGYVYRTTLEDGRTYIGQKKSDHFVKSYYGSGTNIKKVIAELQEEYDTLWKDHIKVEIIEECENQSQLDERETYWISYEFENAKYTPLNIAIGGLHNSSKIPIELYEQMRKNKDYCSDWIKGYLKGCQIGVEINKIKGALK